MRIGKAIEINITKEHSYPCTYLEVVPTIGGNAHGVHARFTLHHIGPGFTTMTNFRVHGEGLDQMLEALQEVKDKKTASENQVMMEEAPEFNEGSDADNYEAEQVFQDQEGSMTDHDHLVQAFGALEPERLRAIYTALHAGAEVFFGLNADDDWMTEDGVP